MTVLWTPRALLDLDEISEFIGSGSMDAANRVATRIPSAISGLVSTPYMGRKGRIEGTRELVFALGLTSPSTGLRIKRFVFFAYAMARDSGR